MRVFGVNWSNQPTPAPEWKIPPTLEQRVKELEELVKQKDEEITSLKRHVRWMNSRWSASKQRVKNLKGEAAQ